MIDYEDMILQRQDLLEIYEDDPDNIIVKNWWDDIPDGYFNIISECINEVLN